MKIKVTVPLSLVVEVDVVGSALDGRPRYAHEIAESAAENLVLIEGMSSPHKVTDTIHVDGFGPVRVTYAVADIKLTGQPEAVSKNKALARSTT